MAFQNTRRKLVRLAPKLLSAGGMMTWDLPKTGLLAGIYLVIRGELEGCTETGNVLGKACYIRQVRLFLNSGIDVFRMSGVGYHHLLRDMLEHYVDVAVTSDAKAAHAIAAFNLDMFIPVALNSRDPVGLIMLQNEQTLATLTVEWEAIANIDNAATPPTWHADTYIEPTLEIFTVPLREEDHPPLNMLHQILEESTVITATSGNVDYPWPRGNTYVQVMHGYGIEAVTPADDWDVARIIVNQSETLVDFNPQNACRDFERFHGRARPLGVIPFDMFGSSGLGCFGSARDFFDSALVTDVLSRITINAAETLYTVRRQLVDLGEG